MCRSQINVGYGIIFSVFKVYTFESFRVIFLFIKAFITELKFNNYAATTKFPTMHQLLNSPPFEERMKGHGGVVEVDSGNRPVGWPCSLVHSITISFPAMAGRSIPGIDRSGGTALWFTRITISISFPGIDGGGTRALL